MRNRWEQMNSSVNPAAIWWLPKQRSLSEHIMAEDYSPILDRFAIVLLVVITIFFPPIAMIIGGVMLFNDHPYKKDTGKLLVTSAMVLMIVFIFIFIGTGTLTISL
ncbi:hypothetical protein AB9M62_37190 [Bacillales bacterium AN1005]